jgi:hypothetical protein
MACGISDLVYEGVLLFHFGALYRKTIRGITLQSATFLLRSNLSSDK